MSGSEPSASWPSSTSISHLLRKAAESILNEAAREKARELRVQQKKKDRRNKVLLQSGIAVGIVAVVAVISLIVVNSFRPEGPGPANMASDGMIRWLGQPVGKLVAAEETLKPRVRIIADERLTGAPRDGVQARLDLWLKSHIERLLEPLFRLAAAEDITGIARGVAFQLMEALGVLERQKVAEEVKGLDQPARATLRRYGVRFGAYHIYLPTLLKPAPRVLATQLWALKHGGAEKKGLGAIEQLAASGRTSIVTDEDIPKPLCRIAG